MATHDINGREYAKVTEVTVGTKLEADEGFTCIPWKTISIVASVWNELYIPCNGPDDEDQGTNLSHKHFLDGQMNDEGTHYTGLYVVP